MHGSYLHQAACQAVCAVAGRRMVQYVLEAAQKLNKVQTIVLVVEGAVLSMAAAAYIWLLTLQVAGQRYTVYSVFLAIPVVGAS